jgi:hypothetical protein
LRVRRVRDFWDPADKPCITGAPIQPLNQTFYRKFKIITFRWLTPEEF